MYIVFLAILLTFFIVVSVLGYFDYKKYKGVVFTEKMRCKSYFQSITLLWGATLGIFIMSFIGNISLKDIGFRQINFNYNIWFTVVTLIFSGLAFVFFMYQLIASLVSVKFKEQVAGTTGSEGAVRVLPRTKKEKCLFSFVSLSAGICEELIYRGFMIFLLITIFPDIPVFLIVLLPSILFGSGHIYQGLKGVFATGALGALFLCLFLVTDSLLLPMVLHFIVDFSSTFILSEEQV